MYGDEVMVPLRKVWGVGDTPAARKRTAPFPAEMVAQLRGLAELDISDNVAAKLGSMSAATVDRRLAGERKRLHLKGRSATKPGTLLTSQIPIRSWTE